MSAPTGWKITKDHINNDGIVEPRVGYGQNIAAVNSNPTIAFRAYDDDGILYYEGRLIDDEDCESQSDALDWMMWDAGVTAIKVRRGNVWKQEIA